MAERPAGARMSRVLIVDDDEAQQFTLAAILGREGFEVVPCGTAAEALHHVEELDVAVAIVDLRLPDQEGTRLLEEIQRRDGAIRVIIHTAYGSFDSAKEAVNKGAFAYVEKAGDPDVLVHHVHRAFREQMGRYAADLEQAVAERTASLRRSEERFRSVLAAMPDPVFVVDAQGRFQDVFAGESALLVESAGPITGSTLDEVYPPEVAQPLSSTVAAALATGEVQRLNYAITTDGESRFFAARIVRFGPADDPRVMVVARDVTRSRQAELRRAELEDRLRHTQKMEALGTMAAGVAHDFSNLLTAIMGYASLARRHLPPNSQAIECVDGIEQATKQATGVTKSLLTFSRRTATEKAPINLGPMVGDAVRMLQRMIPASIELVADIAHGDELWIMADATQLQQVILNLAVNARDAMPDGGRLRIAARPGSPAVPPLAPDGATATAGTVILEVEDTGVGMSSGVQARIFEPFFTTKTRLNNTGLGLAVVHGIVGDHAGHIDVDSQEGVGTRVTITLPRCDAPADTTLTDAHEPADGHHGRGELIVLAEDNAQIRAILVATLRTAGYRVVAAEDGVAAVEAIEQHASDLRLAILDVDLPRKSGLAVLENLHAREPTTPAILITGSLQAVPAELDARRATVLRKPFRMSGLLSAVHRVIARPRRSAPRAR